jgi:hypothetical protein
VPALQQQNLPPLVLALRQQSLPPLVQAYYSHPLAELP